jgi:hypothetical protein
MLIDNIRNSVNNVKNDKSVYNVSDIVEMYKTIDKALVEFELSLRTLVSEVHNRSYRSRDLSDVLKAAASTDNAGINCALSNYLECRQIKEDFEKLELARVR